MAAAQQLHPRDLEAARFAAYETAHQLAEALGEPPPEPWQLLEAERR